MSELKDLRREISSEKQRIKAQRYAGTFGMSRWGIAGLPEALTVTHHTEDGVRWSLMPPRCLHVGVRAFILVLLRLVGKAATESKPPVSRHPSTASLRQIASMRSLRRGTRPLISDSMDYYLSLNCVLRHNLRSVGWKPHKFACPNPSISENRPNIDSHRCDRK